MAKTKTYEAKWEFLRDELRKDFWVVKDAMELLCGWVKANVTPEGRLGHGEFKQWFPLFETEQKRPERDQFKRMQDIWDGSEHDYFQNNFRNVGSRDSLEIRVSHLIEWADSKKIEIPWRGWAEEMELLQGNVPDPIPENKKMGKTEKENLIRLIGILRNMLKDDTVISDLKRASELFKKNSDLTDHIIGHYKEDRENKGLSATKLNTIWAEAKRILEKDKDF